MPLSARDLLNSKAKTQDGAFSISQIYFMPETWRLRHVVLDLGGWFHSEEVLVSVERFAMPQGGEWPLRMDREELEGAPKIDDTSYDSTSLPPLIVGPFGNTFSPLMFAAVQSEQATSDVPRSASTEAQSDGSERVAYMDKVTDWLGLEVFGDAGALGRIEDLHANDALVMTHAVLDDGTELALSRYRRMADQGHALFD